KVGDTWQLQVRLKRPHSTQNPGEFDYEAYLLQNHIRATGYVVNNQINHCLNSTWYHHFIDRIRQSWEMKIRNSLVDQTYTNFIVALLVGDQNNIDADEWQVLQRTGTIHFLVIAGLHIGFVAELMFYLGKLLWQLLPRLCLLIPAQEVGAISALLSACFYSALAGFSIPTQRAIIMITVFMIGTLLRRNLVNFYTLLLTLFFVLLINPLSSLTSGFWLSFAAVFFIIYALHGRIQTQHKLLRYGRLQLALTLGLLPFTLMLFQQAPLVSFFGNAIAVPWIGFVVIPLCFTGGLLLLGNEMLGHAVLLVTTKAIGLIWLWLAWLASLPIASWQHAISNIWVLISTLLGCLLLLAPKGLPTRYIGIIWLLPLFFYIPPTPKYGEIWFTLLDVGQGLASVIRTQSHILIYDTGPKFFADSDTGATIILPYLKNFALNKIDALVVSHGDADHSGGAKTLINNIPINSVITSVPDFFAPHPATHCYAGQSWRWDGVDFAFLHPASDNNDFSGNNASCVLKISTGKNSILLNGDIETPAETVLVKNAGENLRTKILVAPHHGSQTSSSPTFVAAVQPEYVLFATGYLNRFHFPSNKIVTRYQDNHANTLNTAFTGAITFRFNAQSLILLPEIYRSSKRKFWLKNITY
ncbi:MAG: DNA internalization-related competence protein ComEC/Rec2, partial [Gammaproteobacteria bacterium GWE2_37_16]